MTLKRKRKLYKKKIWQKAVKYFEHQIINGTSYNEPIGLDSKILQEVILKGDADDK